MFTETQISGKHMICDIKGIRNTTLLHDLEGIKSLLDTICNHHDFSILEKVEYKFHPQGLTLLYLLSESHISIHTFPERDYIALDLYTCRSYNDDRTYLDIYNTLIESFKARKEKPMIINRSF
jgi:S-adenosylmethionine decarboxylase